MHELSIAEALAGVAERHAAGRPVSRVEVSVGHLRQVVPSALELAFELVTRDTVLEGAELAITHVAAEGSCRECGARSVMEGFPLACGRCGGLGIEVVAGEELQVEALEVHTAEMATIGGGR